MLNSVEILLAYIENLFGIRTASKRSGEVVSFRIAYNAAVIVLLRWRNLDFRKAGESVSYTYIKQRTNYNY